MRCDRVRDVLFEYRRGLLPGSERDDVADHLNCCEMCRRQLTDLTSFEVLARDWQDLEPPPWNAASVVTGPAPLSLVQLCARWLPLAAALVLTAFVAAGTEIGHRADGFYVRFGSGDAPPGGPSQAPQAVVDAERLQTAIERLRAEQAMERELLRAALLAASTNPRRGEIEAMLALVRAQLDGHAEDARDSLRFVIDLQQRDERRLSELDDQLQRIGYRRDDGDRREPR